MKFLSLLKVFITTACLFGVYSLGECAVTAPVVSMSSPDTFWVGAKTCSIRFATADNYGYKQGEINWLIQNYENFEGQLVVGNTAIPIASANGEMISIINTVHLNNTGSFTIQFILKDGTATDLTKFCTLENFWAGDGFPVVIK